MKVSFTLFHCLPVSVSESGPKGLHTHDMHEFFICTNSRGTQYADNWSAPNRKDSLFFFPLGVRHYCSGLVGLPAKGYVIMVPDDMFSPEAFGDRESFLALQHLARLARQGQYPLPLGKATARAARRMTAGILKEYTQKKPGFQASIRARLQEMLVQIMRDPAVGKGIAGGVGAVEHDERMAHLFRFLDEYFMEKMPVARAAKMAGMSRSHFHLVFKAKSGCTFVEYLTRLRVRAALRLLHESDLPIAQVALDCGFSTLSRFYEALKAVTGKTPRRIRAGS
jgi:AraC-like DNA-binding protein